MGEPVRANQVEVSSFYVRQRHCMAVFGDFGDLYVDYYLHQMQLPEKPTPEADGMLKEALAAIALHLLTRPANEQTAWTMNFQEPLLNLFVTGDSEQGNVVGRVFTRDVRRGERNLFFSQVTRPHSPARQSTVEVEGAQILDVVEQYYKQSEQLPARFFALEGDAFALLQAHPDHDPEWFAAQTAESMKTLLDDEEHGNLAKRKYHFGCGCTLKRILITLAPVARRGLENLFGDEDEVKVGCPRCGGQFDVSRAQVSEYLDRHPE